MDNNQRFLLQSKNPFQNQINQPNMVLQYNYSDQNKNLNESMITTSTSSLSGNNKKNLQHTNYKTPKKKNFQIPMPKPKNPKQNNQKILDKNSKNTNTINTIVYTKGTIKKFNNQNSNNAFIYNNHNSNLNNNNNNKIYGGSMNHIEMENDNNINHTKRTLNNINSSNINSYMNKSSLNKKRINKVNEEMNKEYNNEVSYFSNNEEETNNQIVNNTINHINNINNYNNYNDQYQKKINSNHRTILKEYDNKFSTGYYSESDQRKEKSAVLNIEEILMTEEKLSAVISCISNGITCEEECFDWFNSYFNTALSNYIEKYFIKEEFIKVIRIAINLNVFSLMLCYDISYNPEACNIS